MRRIDGLRDIVDQFDLYLVDQYGVLHDGVAAYPGAIEGLARIGSGGRVSWSGRVVGRDGT